MTWNIVHLNDVPPTPWRNGGGTTRELMAWPDPAAWQWRASVAEVVRSGPFSSFVGVQRWFAVLEGDGVCLTIDDHQYHLSKDDAPLAFDGSAQTDCELLGGSTQDFNLMVQGSTAARMLRVNGGFTVTLNAPKIIAAYAHKERATVRFDTGINTLLPNSFGWMHVQAGTAVNIQASNALLMEIDV